MNSGNVHASSLSLNVNYNRAAVPSKWYMCDRCRSSIQAPGVDGSVRDMPCHISCGHLCCWACTAPSIGSPSSRCPACGKVADVRFEHALYRALTERAALAKSPSCETLGSETACSCDGCHKDTGLACIEECQRDSESDSDGSDDTDWSSDEEVALGEVSDDEEGDGGALCEPRQPPSRKAKGQQAPVNVFDFLESEDTLVYQEKAEYSSRPVSRERHSRPANYQTRRYSVTPDMMAATTPLFKESWRNGSSFSLSSTLCQTSPTSSEFGHWQGHANAHGEMADGEKPRGRRRRRHTRNHGHDKAESSFSADMPYIEAPPCTQYSHRRAKASDDIRPPLRKHHSDKTMEIGRRRSSYHGYHRQSIPLQFLDDDDPRRLDYKHDKHKKHHRKTRSLVSVVSTSSGGSGGSRHSSNGKHKGTAAPDWLLFFAGGKPGPKPRK